ncbi:uncharacterized exonuclease C637.09 [Aplysia californica]|uniref:Uncharacterized exonuclease C637.09 n=1 Tax=Aplysia californica TaxID=6500 RepID=A0ABM0K5J3_APLCA|nr:uncharacterized exonuclease C637.09 [Aplysia californica]
MNSKKAKRLESKKKKAAAFLELVGHKRTHDDSQVSGVEKLDEQNMDSSTKNESSHTNESQGEDVLQEMKKIMRERKKQAMQKPKVFLTLEDMVPFRPVPGEPLEPDVIPPLFVMDLQQLLLYGAQGNVASFKPRWCKLLRVAKVSSIVVILVDGIGYSDYLENTHCFPYISASFPHHAEMVCPLQYNQTVDTELYNVPLSVSQLKKTNKKVPQRIRKVVGNKLALPPAEKKTDVLSRKCLLLSTYQMMQESYPLPIVTQRGTYRDFVFSKEKYKKVTENSPLLALDCEMCLTTARRNELTRVSIVSETGEVIYDSLVKPYRQIINYLTRYSGITKEILDPVTTRIEDVQRDIREILPADAILCGQSLNGDLIALKMFHPYVIDTSVIFNMSGSRGVKAGLRKLTQFFLGRSIQTSSDGHCSAEDALAALDLVKLKLSKGLEFGDATLNGIYFPDIKTYFLGEETNTGRAENVETDENSSQSSADKDLSTADNSGQVASSEPVNQKDNAATSEKAPATAAVTAPDSSETASDSEDSGDEDDSGDRTSNQGDAAPPAKKAKVEEDSNSTSEPNTSAGHFDSTSEFVEEQKKLLFSQGDSVHVNHSFFQLVYEAGRPACLIDREAVASKYSKEPVETITVSSDTVARKTAKRRVTDKEFLWVRFQEMLDVGGKEQLSQQKWQKQMRKLDNRVSSVMRHANQDTLAVVVMTGRQEGSQIQNMATFLTTT